MPRDAAPEWVAPTASGVAVAADGRTVAAMAAHEDHPPAPTTAEHWDARYGERDDGMWSGRPNGRLVAEVEGLPPGRALDVGCGEGADAIWLAQRGWAVTAVDISAVAVDRARRAAARVAVAVDWQVGDVLAAPPSPETLELVSLQYPALPKAAGEDAVQALLASVRRGGVLLAVYHDLDEAHAAHMRERGMDPAAYVLADDLVALLDDSWEVVRHEVAPRLDPPPGTEHVADVVLRAHRR